MPFFEQAREHSGWRFHQTCGLLAKWMWSCCGLAVWHHCWLETSCTTLFWARLGKVSWGLLRLKRTPFRSSEVSGTFWPSRWRHPVVVIAPESTRKTWGCYVGHALRTMFLIYLYILVMVQFSSCVFFVVLLSLHTYITYSGTCHQNVFHELIHFICFTTEKPSADLTWLWLTMEKITMFHRSFVYKTSLVV